MGLFDVHAHMTDRRMAEREEQVTAAARHAGLTSVLSNGLHPGDNEAVLSLSRRNSLIKPCFGLYPVEAVMTELQTMGVEIPREGPIFSAEESLSWLAEHLEEAFAIGEVGLDHHWVPEPLWQLQADIFRKIVRMARNADKVLIIHTRRAEAAALELLREERAHRVNWHCFSSKLKLAQQIAAEGHYLSVPANAIRAEPYRRLLSDLPKNRLLLETDCPYLSPIPGTPSEPAHVAGTAKLAASLWGVEEEQAINQLETNFQALFGCPP
jgi:TatD DNase family protein